MNYTLPSIPYAYDELEPYFDKETMEIHHTKHHQTYINNVNIILKKLPEFSSFSIEKLITYLNEIPQSYRTTLKNNAGGHVNHSLFWKTLKKGTILKGELKLAIEQNFNSVTEFKRIFENTGVSHFGSGWVWLVLKSNNKLDVISTANQDSPLMNTEDITYPVFGLDLWEHAYYLKYQNRRQDYIREFWNVINWDEAEMRFSKEKYKRFNKI